MSIATRILFVVALLSLALGTRLAIDAASAMHRAEEATEQQRQSETSGRLILAASKLALERGLVSGLLARPDPASSVTREQRTQILAARSAAAEALATAKGQLPDKDSASIAAIGTSLAELRLQAGQSFDGATPAAWFSRISNVIDAVVTLRQDVDARSNGATTLQRLFLLRDRLAEMAEFAGRERGTLNTILSGSGNATPAQLYTLGTLAGRIDASLPFLTHPDDRASPALVEALQSAATVWGTEFGPLRQGVMEAQRQRTAGTVDAKTWFAASTRAIDAILQAQVAAGADIALLLMKEQSSSGQLLLLSGLVFAAALLLAVGLVFYIRSGIMKPLLRSVANLFDISEDRLEAVLPPPKGALEIKRLMDVTLHFQQTARSARAMRRAQEELRVGAEKARGDAIREIGDMIEQVSGEAIADVHALTSDLHVTADEVHVGAGSIAQESRQAALDANDARAGAEAANQSTRELSIAIREIAQQVERAAQTTRQAVSRTKDAEAVFATLSANVTEIDEVARLISVIAGRTNLLALNATIEAARAGEAGRGFAVVAGEVKNLAQETGQSKARIAQRIAAIEQSTREAVLAVGAILASISEIDQIASAVAAAAEEQSVATSSIAEAVARSSEAADRVARRMRDVAAGSEICRAGSGRLNVISLDVNGSVTGLKSKLVSLMRTRVGELNRRTDTRIAVKIPSRVGYSNGASAGILDGHVVDLGAGGARFVAESDKDWPANSLVDVTIDGLPTMQGQVVRRQDRLIQLAFVFSSKADELNIRQFVEALAVRTNALAA